MKKSSYFKSEQHYENLKKALTKSQITIKCEFCHKEFNSGSIVRHTPSCLYDPSNAVYCLCCNQQIFEYQKKFCSRSCSATYNNYRRPPKTDAQKQKTSETMKRKYRSGELIPNKGGYKHKRKNKATKVISIKKICLTCEEEFLLKYPTSPKLFCSRSCSASANKHKWGKQMSIPYYCKETNSMISLQSNWEIEIAEYLDNIGIRWKRPKGIKWLDSTGKKRTYNADFYLLDHNIYLDPKNPRVVIRDQEKLTAVSKMITLVYGDPKIIKLYVITLI